MDFLLLSVVGLHSPSKRGKKKSRYAKYERAMTSPRSYWYVGIALVIGLATYSIAITDFDTCNRSCRYVHGFFDRDVKGKRVGAFGHEDPLGRHCACSRKGETLGTVDRLIYDKTWENDTWNGEGNNYTTEVRCVLRGNESVTISSVREKRADDVLLHCGACSACSDLHDMKVIYDTKSYITTNMTICSTAFASPLSKSHGDYDALVTCLRDAGIDFSRDGRAWSEADREAKHLPTCMDCWTDNIMNDAVYCRTNPSCIAKFFDPKNSGAFQVRTRDVGNNPRPSAVILISVRVVFRTEQGCLKCDEDNSGAEFIRCAGSNRRSTGIRSDIDRHEYEICTDGYYYGK